MRGKFKIAMFQNGRFECSCFWALGATWIWKNENWLQKSFGIFGWKASALVTKSIKDRIFDKKSLCDNFADRHIKIKRKAQTIFYVLG